MRDECVIRFVGVRGGYKAMVGCMSARERCIQEWCKYVTLGLINRL